MFFFTFLFTVILMTIVSIQPVQNTSLQFVQNIALVARNIVMKHTSPVITNSFGMVVPLAKETKTILHAKVAIWDILSMEILVFVVLKTVVVQREKTQ